MKTKPIPIIAKPQKIDYSIDESLIPRPVVKKRNQGRDQIDEDEFDFNLVFEYEFPHQKFKSPSTAQTAAKLVQNTDKDKGGTNSDKLSRN